VRQPEPLRWIIASALLLALLSICCVAEIVTRALIPRDLATALNLLSKDRADYSPWLVPPGLAAIPPELAAAEASERATATSVALAPQRPDPAGRRECAEIQTPVMPPAPDAPTPTTRRCADRRTTDRDPATGRQSADKYSGYRNH